MRNYAYDVVIIGGGIAGVAAAIGSAHAGARTLLIERNPCLGGTATNCGIVGICGIFAGTSLQKIVTGAADVILSQLELLEGEIHPVINDYGNTIILYSIENLKLALDSVLRDFQIDVLLHTNLIEVQTNTEKDKIIGVNCLDECGVFHIEGHSFIDASGNANLAFLAEAETLFGDKGKIQAATLIMKVGGFDPTKSYDIKEIEVALRKAQQSGFKNLTKMRGQFWPTKQENILSISIANYPLKDIDGKSLTKAEQQSRQIVQEYIRAFRSYLPGMENCFLVFSGPQIGLRESRRLVCERMLSIGEAQNGIQCDDRIANAGWPFELHDDPNWTSRNKPIKNHPFFTIPLSCLRSEKVKNLWCAGRIIGVDHETLSSVRVMGTCMATGHAAGVAAAIVNDDTTSQVKSVQDELIRQGATLN